MFLVPVYDPAHVFVLVQREGVFCLAAKEVQSLGTIAREEGRAAGDVYGVGLSESGHDLG